VTFGVTASVGNRPFRCAGGHKDWPRRLLSIWKRWWLRPSDSAAYPAWGVANILDEKNREALHQIARLPRKHDGPQRQQRTRSAVYAACMDEAKIKLMAQTIQAELRSNAKIKTRPRCKKKSRTCIQSVSTPLLVQVRIRISRTAPKSQRESLRAAWACRTVTTISRPTTSQSRFAMNMSSTWLRCSS
jgi:hypothetical protein